MEDLEIGEVYVWEDGRTPTSCDRVHRNRLHHCLNLASHHHSDQPAHTARTPSPSRLASGHACLSPAHVIQPDNRHIANHHTTGAMTASNNNGINGIPSIYFTITSSPMHWPPTGSLSHQVHSLAQWLLIMSQIRRRLRSTTMTTATPKPPRWLEVSLFQVIYAFSWNLCLWQRPFLLVVSRLVNIEHAWPFLIPMVCIYSILSINFAHIFHTYHRFRVSLSTCTVVQTSPRSQVAQASVEWWMNESLVTMTGVASTEQRRHEDRGPHRQTHFTYSCSTISKIFRCVTTAFIRSSTIYTATEP